MPLVQGNSREAISENIRRELAAGKKRAQSIAIALDVARRSARGRADGGMAPPPMSWDARQEAREAFAPASPRLFNSAVPGRTDQHNVEVPGGTFILPSDVVSGIGDGNTMAGASIVERMLGSGPYGTRLPRGGGRGSGLPRPPPMFREGMFEERAAGGETGAETDGRGDGLVPIVVAGGEMQIPPEIVAHHPMLGGLHPMDRDPENYRKALDRGTEILNGWVVHERKKTIRTLKSLPGPKK